MRCARQLLAPSLPFRTPLGDAKKLSPLPLSLSLAFPQVLDLALRDDDRANGAAPWTLGRAEVVVALASLAHSGLLAKRDAGLFTRAGLLNALRASPRCAQHASAAAALFLARFAPGGDGLSDDAFAAASAKLRAEIERDFSGVDVVAHALLHALVDLVAATHRTNYYLEGRWALALRVAPGALAPPASAAEAAPRPFGVFFVHGRRFNAFHTRFKDVARGGLRLVTPASREQLAFEAARHYDECFNLALAQQLKNKDIPEGGSKAVALIDTTDLGRGAAPGVSSAVRRDEVMRKTVKAFADAMLDLIVDTDATRARVVQRNAASSSAGADDAAPALEPAPPGPEVIFLGPDEQVIPADINYVVARAARRGYPIPPAFMSSKPDAGINHKEFGVTSEGVVVFLEHALRSVGIDPRAQDFSVKMTGGPDGDVAGNAIRILAREYGARARIVGVADATGCAEDPSGLDAAELMRLVDGELPIVAFARERLGPLGAVHDAAADEGRRLRDSMHARVVADAFVPAGGRPGTLNDENWRAFLVPGAEGAPPQPSARVIVEGANLFVTAGARRALFEHAGVRIVKDSSANKCGVICSSFEIQASMLLDEAEIAAVKPAVVADVLARLRALAHAEATLLFREFANYPGALPAFSERISGAINAATDAVGAALDAEAAARAASGAATPLHDALLPLVRAHLPAALADAAWDRLEARVPAQYVRNAMASCVASKLVYTEGVHFVEALPRERLASLALDYVNAQARVDDAASAVRASADLAEPLRDEVAALLERKGARAVLGL